MAGLGIYLQTVSNFRHIFSFQEISYLLNSESTINNGKNSGAY
jgi:hypothetical protein